MENSPWTRLCTAAGFYVLVIWGHMTLETNVPFALFFALAMAAMLVLWSRQASLVAGSRRVDMDDLEDWQSSLDEALQDPEHRFGPMPGPAESSALSRIALVDKSRHSSLASTMARLDAIRTELKSQYAQLGRDQTAWRTGSDSWIDRSNGAQS